MSTGARFVWWVGFVITLAAGAVGVSRLTQHGYLLGVIFTAAAVVLAVALRLTCDDALGTRTV